MGVAGDLLLRRGGVAGGGGLVALAGEEEGGHLRGSLHPHVAQGLGRAVVVDRRDGAAAGVDESDLIGGLERRTEVQALVDHELDLGADLGVDHQPVELAGAIVLVEADDQRGGIVHGEADALDGLGHLQDAVPLGRLLTLERGTDLLGVDERDLLLPDDRLDDRVVADRGLAGLGARVAVADDGTEEKRLMVVPPDGDLRLRVRGDQRQRRLIGLAQDAVLGHHRAVETAEKAEGRLAGLDAAGGEGHLQARTHAADHRHVVEAGLEGLEDEILRQGGEERGPIPELPASDQDARLDVLLVARDRRGHDVARTLDLGGQIAEHLLDRALDQRELEVLADAGVVLGDRELVQRVPRVAQALGGRDLSLVGLLVTTIHGNMPSWGWCCDPFGPVIRDLGKRGLKVHAHKEQRRKYYRPFKKSSR